MPLGQAAINAETKDMENINSSLEFLQYIYKNPAIDRKIRIEAAKAALPYETGKIAEKGKKEQKENDAQEAAKAGKFATLENQLRN